MKTVGIVGGWSHRGLFGLALRAAGFGGEILGVSSPSEHRRGSCAGAIDAALRALKRAAVRLRPLLLFAADFRHFETLQKLDPLVRPDALVTDVGSTKQAIVAEANRSLKRCAFLGGHPMAGKELRGVAAADADLFRGRPWVLTFDLDHPLRKWIARFGAREIILDPVRHDRLVAWSSHLPQLASTALASVLHDQAPDAAMVAGPGLLDSTRLALSSFDLWRDILDTNQSEVSRALDAYILKLQSLRTKF